MRKIISFCLALLVAGFLYLGAATAAESSKEGWPTHLVFLSGPNGGQWFTMGTAIAEVLNNDVLPTSSRKGGGVSNLKDIENKRGDIGFTLTSFMGAADSNEQEYQDFKLDNVSIIANVYPQVLYVLLRKDFADKYKIATVRDLLALKAPVRFASLKPGTASEFVLDMLLKYGYNTDFDKLKQQDWRISFNNYAETADNFVAGDLDCFAYTAGTNVPLIKIMEEHLEVVILPIESAVLATLSEKFKTLTYVIEPGDYNNIDTPIATLGSYTTLITRKNLPDSLVYKVLDVLFENKKYIAENSIDFDTLAAKTATSDTLPMHPGALKFWNDMKNK